MVGLGFSISSSCDATGATPELVLLLLLGDFEQSFATARDRPLSTILVPLGFPGAKMTTSELDGGPRLCAATLP